VTSFLEGRRRLLIFEPGAVFEMRDRRVACLDSRFRRLVGALEDVGRDLVVVGREGRVGLRVGSGGLGACCC